MSNPLWINEDGGQPEYTAQSLRLSMSGLLTKGVPDRLGARPGVIPNGRDAVSLSGVQVTVHDCNLVLNPALSSQDGPYIAHFTEHTHTLEPGDGSNDRVDLIVARVYDDDHDGSGQREAVTELITGTPSPSPARPPVPTGALLLAEVAVPADGTGSPTLDYVAPATTSAGGVLPVRSDAELPGDSGGLYEGAVRWNSDTQALEVHNGSNTWQTLSSLGSMRQRWEYITPAGGQAINGWTTFNFEAGRYDKIVVTLRGRLQGPGYVLFRLNDDSSSMYQRGYTVWNFDSGSVEESASLLGTSFTGPRWDTALSNWAEATFFGTNIASWIGYHCQGGEMNNANSNLTYTTVSGRTRQNILPSSIRVLTSVSSSNFDGAQVWIEGRRA